MKKQIKSFLIFHMIACFCGFVLYFCLFQIPVFDFIEIYFYKGIFLVVVSGVLCGVIESAIKVGTHTMRFDCKDIMSSIVIIMCVNMVWLSVAIVNVDRSFSVWMLSYLNKNPSGYEMLDEAFHEQFIEDYGMLDRRLEEQLESNNIYIDNGSYKLTKQGEKIAAIFRMVGKLYKTSEQYYNPPELEKS